MQELNLTILQKLWERANQESQQPQNLLNTWITEVTEWAKLSDYQNDLRQAVNLWLPTSDEKELETLLGLAMLTNAMGGSPIQIIQKLLFQPEIAPVDSLELSKVKRIAIIEILDDLQTTFEKALTELKLVIELEALPADDLTVYMSEAFELIRQALNLNRRGYAYPAEVRRED